MTLVLAAAAVLVGAVANRITGIGFALVAAPLLVAALGPRAGVTTGNVLQVVLCVLVLATAWRDVRVHRALLMVVPAVLGIAIGALVVRAAPIGPLAVAVGLLALVAVGLTALGDRVRLLPGRGGAVAAGALSGFMNATAGVGGPMLAVHAYSDGWSRREFVGTGQAFLLAVNVTSVLTKGPPALPPAVWLVLGVALTAGIGLGQVLSPRIDERLGRRLVLGLAAVGSASAVLRGLLSG